MWGQEDVMSQKKKKKFASEFTVIGTFGFHHSGS